MQEDVEPASCQREQGVADGEPYAQPPGPARKAHDQQLARVVSGRAGKARHVGIAADDPVQDHDVGAADLAGGLGEIHHRALDAVLQPCLAEEVDRYLLVGRRQLDAERTRRAGLEEFDLDRPDAASDLEHRLALDPLGLQEVDDPPRGCVESLAPVPLSLGASAALAENPLVALGRAAIAHIQPRRRNNQSWIAVAMSIVPTPTANAA